MSDCDNISPYLFQAGITDLDRTLKMLLPESVSIMHLGVKEWVTFTQALAKHINFYTNNDESPTGDWQSFFDQALALKDEIATYDAGELPAHITLLVAFLNLLEYSRTSINQLTKRHLDYYYRDVLQLKNKAFQADKIYTVFELNKNIEEYLVEKGTLLHGGKDENGTLRNYAVTEDTVINKCTIADYKSLYADDSGLYKNEPEAASELNGIWPFGSPQNDAAPLGFSVSSHSLFLKEGDRKVFVTLNFNETISPQYTLAQIVSGMQFSFSSEKEWTDRALTNFYTEGKQFTFIFNFTADDEALVAPNMEVHGRVQSEPCIKFLFKNSFGRQIFNSWSALTMNKIIIITDTDYENGLVAKTDQGVVDASNEFYPFGSVPKRGSKFKIHSEEWRGKRILSALVKLKWKDLPEDLTDTYKAYKVRYWTHNFSPSYGSYTDTSTSVVTTTNGNDRFKVQIGANESALFPNEVYENSEFSFAQFGTTYNPKSADEYNVDLTLLNDFCHKEYGIITTIAVIKNLLLPLPPYAPLAEKVAVNIRTEALYKNDQHELTFSWELPFGHRSFTQLQPQLLPNIESNQGELFLGIENENENQLFQFLIKLEEGSENPERLDATGLNTIKWTYLSGNEWQDLKPLNVLKNQTDNFLTSGLFQFVVPKYDANTLLPAGKLWLRAKLNNYYDTASRVHGFFAQTILAEFQNNNNGLAHLKNGIESETVAKLVNKRAQVKKVKQPFASFNGKPEEEDANYYTRTSERLRHKNRSVSIWDYEHLLLEEFSFIHKVKALNHSIKDNYIQPGEVLIVAVPSMVNQKVFNVLKPVISQAKLNLLAAYVNERNSLHVEAKVLSPIYLPIKISAKVKYNTGSDANYYDSELRKDITAFLAPWTRAANADIQFGGNVYYSQVVYFIENLPYIDYVKDVKMSINGSTVNNTVPTNPMTIITSVPANEHDFETLKESLCTL